MIIELTQIELNLIRRTLSADEEERQQSYKSVGVTPLDSYLRVVD